MISDSALVYGLNIVGHTYMQGMKLILRIKQILLIVANMAKHVNSVFLLFRKLEHCTTSYDTFSLFPKQLTLRKLFTSECFFNIERK